MSELVQPGAKLTLVVDGLMKSGADVLDSSGTSVARLETGADRRRQTVNLSGGASFFLDGKQTLFKTELTALDGDEVLAHISGDELTSGGRTYSLNRRRRSIPVPWVLSDGDSELASFTRHMDQQIEIDVTGSQPVPLLLLVFCCQWSRLKARRTGSN